MYRIELAPGEEALFRNIDELAKAIHTGVISPHARIWHGASNKWLPIDFHPHYKIAKERPVAAPAPAKPVADVAPRSAPRPVAQRVFEPKPPELDFIHVEPEPVRKPTPTAGQVGAVVSLRPPAPAVPAPAPVPVPAPAPVTTAAASAPAITPRHIEALVAVAAEAPAARQAEDLNEVMIDISAPPSRFSRRTIGIAAASILAVAGFGGMAMSRASSANAPDAEMAVASTSLAATPPTSFEIAAGTPPEASKPVAPATATGLPMPGTDRAAADSARPIIPAAPTLATARGTFSIDQSSLTDVSSEAQQELESRLRASGVSDLFAPARLQSGQLGSTRLAVAGAANLVRTYRAKAIRTESPEAARAADALLADIEGLLGVLADHEGSYEISGNAVKFSDESLSTRYSALRRRIAARTAAGSHESPVASALLQVIGNTAPPAVGSAN